MIAPGLVVVHDRSRPLGMAVGLHGADELPRGQVEGVQPGAMHVVRALAYEQPIPPDDRIGRDL